MVVTMEQVRNGIIKYIEREVAMKAVGIQKFMAYFVIPSVPSKMQELITKYQAFLVPYLDENGNVKIDELYQVARSAMEKTIQFEYSGIVFKGNDIDLLYNYIRE